MNIEEKITQALLLSDYAAHLLRMLLEKDNQPILIRCIKNPSNRNMHRIAMCYIAPLAVEYVKRAEDITADEKTRKEMKRLFAVMDEIEVEEENEL